MTWLQIFIGSILALIIYFKLKKFFVNRKAIGQRVMINYFDQNDHFESIFPKKGAILKTIQVCRQKMFVLVLDEQFTHNHGNFKKIAVKERHAGSYIGDHDEVHVHVLLPKYDVRLNQDKYSFSDFDHVVWATVTPSH